MTEPKGPWSDEVLGAPPAPQRPAPPARSPRRLVLWLCLIAAVVLFLWAMTQIFPGQLAGMNGVEAVRLVGLLALVSSGLLTARQINWGQKARHAAIWIGLVLVAALGFAFRGDVTAAALRLRGELIPAYAVQTGAHTLTINRSDDGGFYVVGAVNGAPVRFLVDTGSTDTVLTPADAQRVGVHMAALKYSSAAATANGVGYGAPITAQSLAVGPIRVENMPITVNQTPMPASLLGMSFFKRMDSVEMRGGQLVVRLG